MATRNEDRDKNQEDVEGGNEEGRSKGIKTIDKWKGDTTMLFASGWGMGMMNMISIHRAPKSRTIGYQKNNKENDKRLFEQPSWVWKLGALDIVTSQQGLVSHRPRFPHLTLALVPLNTLLQLALVL
jgi:hypothetical protein